MGPDRRQHLTNALSVVVALNLVVALVVIYARGNGLTGGWDRDRADVEILQASSILAGGNFIERRTSPPSTQAPVPPPTRAGTPRHPPDLITSSAAEASGSAQQPITAFRVWP